MHYFGFGYSEEAKINAARSLLNHLKDPSNILLDSSFIDVLKNGRLGTLYGFYYRHSDGINNEVIENHHSRLRSESIQEKPPTSSSSQKELQIAIKSQLRDIKTSEPCISEEKNETECRLAL